MHWVLAHPGHPLPSHQLFLGVLVLLSLAQTLSQKFCPCREVEKVWLEVVGASSLEIFKV